LKKDRDVVDSGKEGSQDSFQEWNGLKDLATGFREKLGVFQGVLGVTGCGFNSL